jgi:TolB-like protein
MRKITSSIIVSLILLSSSSFGASNLEAGVAEVGKSIAQSMQKEGKKKIAVIEFSDLNDNVNDLGRFLAEELINELLKNKEDKGYEIVERRQLNKVLKQLKLSSSGLLDPKSMKEVGKVLNVDAIVTGSLTDLGNDIKVNARIISVESAKIISSASTKIPKVGSVAKLMGENSVKVTSSNSSSSTTTAQPSKKSTKGKYLFENKEISIEFKNLEGSTNSSWAYINAIYTNKTDKVLEIQIDKKRSYMMDDNGVRWNISEAIFFDEKAPLTIDPKRKLTSKITLSRSGRDSLGEIYDTKMYYTVNEKDIEVKVYDIKRKIK